MVDRDDKSTEIQSSPAHDPRVRRAAWVLAQHGWGIDTDYERHTCTATWRHSDCPASIDVMEMVFLPDELAVEPVPARCRGSWELGSACGECQRCRDEAVELVPRLVRDFRVLQGKMVLVCSVCETVARIGDSMSREFRDACLQEIQRIVGAA